MTDINRARGKSKFVSYFVFRIIGFLENDCSGQLKDLKKLYKHYFYQFKIH